MPRVGYVKVTLWSLESSYHLLFLLKQGQNKQTCQLDLHAILSNAQHQSGKLDSFVESDQNF